MRYQYRITWKDGKSGFCISPERLYDALRHFRQRFGQGIASVEERYSNGEWRPSELLPTTAEESASLREERQ